MTLTQKHVHKRHTAAANTGAAAATASASAVVLDQAPDQRIWQQPTEHALCWGPTGAITTIRALPNVVGTLALLPVLGCCQAVVALLQGY